MQGVAQEQSGDSTPNKKVKNAVRTARCKAQPENRENRTPNKKAKTQLEW